MSKIALKSSSTRLPLQRVNLPIFRRKNNYLSDTVSREKWLKKDSRLKPFGFCCSLDRFNPLSRYDQGMPPYESPLTAITSVHECPVAKMQMKFSMSRLSREKKKLTKTRTSDTGIQQRQSKNGRLLNYSQIARNNRFIRWYLEDEIALAKDIFWAEKQKIYRKASYKAIKIAKKKFEKQELKLKKGPRWYQDFSPDQMKNLMKLESVMRTDYEETKTNGTQTTLIAIGVISTFFKLKPSTIKELHRSCNLNSVDFLREIYKILTGNDFYEEGYKKVYDCNERIILSAIAFLTLPETVKELHKRLPAVIMPRLPPKPKLITCLARRKSSCPYKEELFTRPDWASYRNALQKWRKHCKLVAIPKISLPLNNQFFINHRSLEIKKRKKDMSVEHLKEINTNELQKVCSTTYDQKDTDSSRERSLETGKSASFNILQPSDASQKSSFIRNLSKKPETKKYKIYGPPKPPGASQKSWLGKKDAHYMIAGVSTEDSHDYPVIYEIAGVANVTPSNSDERFFAVLNLDDQTRKIFPSGRENLSLNWQEWLQNADESYRQLEEKTDELIKNVQTIIKLAFPGPVCDSCCLCRQTRKFEEKLQQSKIAKVLTDAAQDEEKNISIADSMEMQSSEQNPTELSTNQMTSEDKIKINVSQFIKNVPPCSCPIQQIADKNISPSVSKEYIPWTKEGLCPGKKYRPNEPDILAYSCKMYPADKFCKYNPFMKEIMKMEKRKIEKQKEKEEVKEKTESIEAKEIQVLKKDVTEEKKDKFIPDPDYPAYDNPWNISRTAPPAKISKTDYETTLKLTWPTISLPLKMQERQVNGIFSSKELKKIKNDALDKKINKKIALKNFQKEMNKTKNEIKNIKNKQSNKINKLTKHTSMKKNRKKNVDEVEKIENRKREMARLMNELKSFREISNDIQPVIFPEELSAIRQHNNPKKNTEEIANFPTAQDEEERYRTKKGPCGWRTKSEQELPAKKTLAYLCEPDYPLETMAVRPGGRPCHCRENRNKKKILMYNVGSLVERKIGGRRAKRTRLEEENRIIDGVLYFTPPVSPRRSDEYVPEYDIFESPYDMCISEATDERLKLIEMYSGPKSLIEKIRKKSKSCNCNDVVAKEDHLVDQKKDLEEARKKLMESKSPEERWKIALKDTALMEYFTQRNDNTPCWTSCKKIARSARPRRLKVVKPVCECKYERKILERNEERTKWKVRQQRLKDLKKQSFMHIVDTSRPMIEEKKFIISDVKRIPREDKKDYIKYCISGVAEDISISPPQKIIDALKMSSPYQTPSSSEEDILQTAELHRHWSPMNIPPGPLPRKDAVLKEEMERRKKVLNEAFKLIYGDKNNQEAFCLTTCNDQEALSKKTSSKLRYQRDALHKEITGKIAHKHKYSEEIVNEVGYKKNVLYKQVKKAGQEIDDGNYRLSGGGDKKYINNKSDLTAILKAELKKMAEEGYTFAKIPKCHLMPQLQDWIMYREGVVFSETDKKNLMRLTRFIWDLINTRIHMEIEKPSLYMTKHQLKKLTFDQAEKMKKKIEKIKATFHSQIRKTRVSYARMMWSTMEHGKFPFASFKRAFFTYMPSKEADGYVYKPWLPSEIHERDVNFCCE